MTPSYFYLRPGAFNLVGFAYGKTEGGSTRGGRVKVKLVHSGRWVEEEAQTAELDQDELTPRAVSGEEAEDVAGTFVGSAICTSTVRPGGGRVWDYGLVVGYHWKAGQSQGWLDVSFEGTTVSIMYNSASTQDVAVEVYALRPCLGQSTSDFMAAEVKAKHENLYNKFNGISEIATRGSKVLLNAVGAKPVDESKIIPLLDITSFEVTEVTIRHVLDFVYYKEGGRTPPTGISFGETIFDKMVPEAVTEARPAVRESELGLSDGLSDSEDVHPRSLTTELPDSQRARQTSKRRRIEPTNTPLVDCNSASTSQSQLGREVDQLRSLQRDGFSLATSRQSQHGVADGGADKQQFHPTGMQSSMHLALINGKYASMTAQRFVELVQIYWRKIGLFRHPAVLRALFDWDFGTRGLSILHFGRVTEQEKWTRVRGTDMSICFFQEEPLLTPPAPETFSTIIGAVEVMCVITQQLYKPVVHDTLVAAANLLGELRVSDLPVSAESLAEIAAWIDDQLELFRVFVTEEKTHGIQQIKEHFSVSHESFIRMHQRILRQDVIAAVKLASTSSNRRSHQTRGEHNPNS